MVTKLSRSPAAAGFGKTSTPPGRLLQSGPPEAMTHTVQLLRELIALPSVNPAFLPPGDRYAGEQRVADYLASVAARLGLSIEFQDVLPGRANLLVRLTPTGRIRHRVLLAPHLDTVGGDPAAIFQPRVKAGRLHGRGACDTKGSVAAMLTALGELARGPSRPAATEIILAGLIDEENGQAGSRALAASRFRADLAIVGEPTRCQVVTAHKGNLWLRLETRGKAAHGARPELGVNAIRRMARVVELLEGPYAMALGRRPHPLLGAGTVNVGVIAGGQQPNIVPDQCAIQIDRRTLPGESAAAVCRQLLAALRPVGFRVALRRTKLAPCGALETDPRLPLVRAFMACTGQTRPLGVDYFCDAAVLAAGGIPAVVFGPGDIAQAHTADEWISLESLELATRRLTRFLQTLP
jgi:acetylornithine deacetylase/succinyl-diaminopimelate desuccinylase-like protein